MKHSVESLTAIAYQHFPRGMRSSDPIYQKTEEYHRRLAARTRASSGYEVWRSMLLRIQERFPATLHPGVMVENQSVFMQSPTAGPLDRCFKAELWLPVHSTAEKHHDLGFSVSFVVPYYIVYSASHVDYPSPPVDDREMFFETVGDTFYAHAEQPPGRPHVTKYEAPSVYMKREISFEIPEGEEPFARGLAEEIEATYPGYTPMPFEVGQVILPDINDMRDFGEVTLFDCLFTEQR